MLHGREEEQALLRRMSAEGRAGRGNALVLRGDAGIGKSALLEFCAEQADAARVLRGAGIEAEGRLPFAALHLLLQPVADRIGALPHAQRAALGDVLGARPQTPESISAKGMALLALLTDIAADGHLLVLIDDAQWLDRFSAEVLLFAARRLRAQGVTMIFAGRGGPPEFPSPGIASRTLEPLDAAASAELLADLHPALVAPVRERILWEAAGNPMALAGLSGALTDRERLGGVFPPIGPLSGPRVPGTVREVFQARVTGLPRATRSLLLLAAIDDRGDLGVLVRAGHLLGVSVEDLEPAEHGGLIELGDRSLAFRHPLVRAVVRETSSLPQRLAAHNALGAAYEGELDGDRRAWHLAAGAVDADEELAALLMRTAPRARARGGPGALAAAFERAASLTPDPSVKADRLAAAAKAALDAGQPDWATSLVSGAAPLPRRPVTRGRLALVNATLAYRRGAPATAARDLLRLAGSINGDAPSLAVTMRANAMRYAVLADDLPAADQAMAALASPSAVAAAEVGMVSAAMAVRHIIAGDPLQGLPHLREVISRARAANGEARLKLLGAHAAHAAGDDDAAFELADALTRRCRDDGDLGLLPEALTLLAMARLHRGLSEDALAGATEGLRLAEDTGQEHQEELLLAVSAQLAAVTGEDERCRALAAKATAKAEGREIGLAESWGTYALGLADLGLGRHADAAGKLEAISGTRWIRSPFLINGFGADLVEATALAGRPGDAAEALEALETWASRIDQPWARAVALRCHALVHPADAETSFEKAVELHAQGGRPLERARTELLWGQWLRRARRPGDARPWLRSALETFETIRAAPWAARARTELSAAGERFRPRDAEGGPLSRLTSQEIRVVRLAAGGASNREIAAQLFLSPRTVAYHLYKAFPKLGVSSRRELRRFQGQGSDADASARVAPDPAA
ncbi:helix-turn-helix transcriptional regulator [Spirillospora sp. CA-128828]|uniref:helix-turn-helix transcriptional regulator n=1 Tax=Spirillospora sp. CA-128828 TaxID=3240033 RepID=UPI003D91080A